MLVKIVDKRNILGVIHNYENNPFRLSINSNDYPIYRCQMRESAKQLIVVLRSTDLNLSNW